MTKTQIKGWLYFASAAFMAVCCFLPIVTHTITMKSGSVTETTVKLMPSLLGGLVFACAIACCLIAILGFKEKAVLFSTITSIFAGVVVWYMSYVATHQKVNTAVDQVLEGVLGKTGDSVIDRSNSYSYGLFLFIFAILFLLASGFFYTFSENDY